ncbi:hypothetical protein OY671_009003, partial [Metschnikowia pulcherrima]
RSRFGVGGGGIGVQTGDVGQHEREIAGRRARRAARHRDRAGLVQDAGNVRRLVRDRLEHALGIAAHAGSDQPVGSFTPGKVHRAVEHHAIEPLSIDIAQEIGGGDGSVLIATRTVSASGISAGGRAGRAGGGEAGGGEGEWWSCHARSSSTCGGAAAPGGPRGRRSGAARAARGGATVRSGDDGGPAAASSRL